MSSAANTIKEFYNALFLNYSTNKACAFLSDDIVFLGTKETDIFFGISDMQKHLNKIISCISCNADVAFSDMREHNLGPCKKLISVKQNFTFLSRLLSVYAAYVLKKEDDIWLINYINLISTSNQSNKKDSTQIKKEVLNYNYDNFNTLTHADIRSRYEKEIRYYSTISEPNLISKCRLNITKNIVEAYTANENVSVTYVGDTYSNAIKKLSLCAAEKGYETKIINFFMHGSVMSYPYYCEDNPIDFMRRYSDGSTVLCSISVHVHKNPETGDLLLFIYSFDITEQKIMNILINKNTGSEFDFIAAVNLNNSQYYTTSCNSYLNIPIKGDYYNFIEHILYKFYDREDKAYYANLLSISCIKNMLEKDKSYSFQFSLKDTSQLIRIKRIRIYYIDKKWGYVFIEQTDITDIVYPEIKQKETISDAFKAVKQSDTAKADFISRISHEIRTPVNTIIGMSAIAENSLENNEIIADCLLKIKASSHFLLSLINDILNMSRMKNGKMFLNHKTIDFISFLTEINEICISQANCKGVTFECNTDPFLEKFYIGDGLKLEQVLINILSNAIKFTPPGGKVTFYAAQIKKDKDSALLRFTIKDTGKGISKNFMPHLFEPFSQEEANLPTSHEGTGLGLSIAKSIIDIMGGNILVRSEKDKGSEFTVEVALKTAPENKNIDNRTQLNKFCRGFSNTSSVSLQNTATLMHSNKNKSPSFLMPHSKEAEIKDFDFHSFHGKRILLAEDHAINAEIAVKILENKGFLVDVAENGLRALEMFSRSKTGYYDAILMDMLMPVMDGISASVNIRKLSNPDAQIIPIIALTANDCSDAAIKECINAGVNAYLTKPIEPFNLYNILFELITKRSNS